MAEPKTQSYRVGQVKYRLRRAVRRVVNATRRVGRLYADIVVEVIAAEKVGMSRALIARVILAEHEAERRRRLVKHTDGSVEEVTRVHKGTAARYVMLARWEQGRFRRGERRVEHVEIDGHRYDSPVKALRSGRHSFTRVFRAWREAVQPPITDLTRVAAAPADAVEAVVTRLTVPVVVKADGREEVRRVRVLEHKEALAGLLRALQASPLYEEAQALAQVLSREVVRAPREPKRGRRRTGTRVAST